MSESLRGTAVVPVEPLEYSLLPHQQVVVESVRKGFRRLLLADEMGLGKTVSAITCVEDERAWPCLVVCPPTLAVTWQREWAAMAGERSVVIWRGGFPVPTSSVVIVPDSVLPSCVDQVRTVRWASLVVDEAHRMKSTRTQRGRAVLNLSTVMPSSSLRLLLTGTPLLNRPGELVAMLDVLGVVDTVFGGMKAFRERYIEGDDIVNADELRTRLLSSVMIRRLRSQVTSLPPTSRSVVPVPLTGPWRERYEATEDAVRGAVRNGDSVAALAALGRLRQITGLARVEATTELVETALESGEQVVVFCWHRSVVSALSEALRAWHPATITGDTAMSDRQRAVDRFQAGTVRLIIGNVTAMGVGLTLTAGRVVVMHELPWTPAALRQAEDRCNRIGQTRIVQSHCVVSELPDRDSVDMRVWRLLERKARMADRLLDGADTVPAELTAQQEVLAAYREGTYG